MRRVIAAGAAIAGTLFLTPAPAYAAPTSDVLFTAQLDQMTLPVDGGSETAMMWGWLHRAEPDDTVGVQAGQLTVDIDFTAVASYAKVELDPDEPQPDNVTCRPTGTVLHCLVKPVVAAPDPIVELGSLRVTPLRSAKAGDTGIVTLTGQADGGPAVTTKTTVRIGEGVDVAAVGKGLELRLAPGGRAQLQPQVRNAGTPTVNGTVLLLDLPGQTGTNFRNCTYGPIVACTFDTALRPGHTYEIAEPLTLGIPADAAAGSATFGAAQWLTEANWEDWVASSGDFLSGEPGTGPELRLNELSSLAGVPQTDVRPDNNAWPVELTVTGTNRPDLAAVGATVTGNVGSEATASVGVLNNGPGTLLSPPFWNNWIVVAVTLPPGLTAVQADKRCMSVDDKQYVCMSESEVRIKPGDRLMFDFVFRIDRAVTSTAGTVSLSQWNELTDLDHTPRNNVAPLALSAAGGGGSGGGLPVTGPGMTIAGAILLLAGVAVVLVLVRRRVRFQA